MEYAMQVCNQELYENILSFKIGSDEDTLSFRDRVARENNWNDEYTNRCVKEYKRFLYLACTAKVNVTPSDQIDQVWHLHLTYTKSYWLEFCQNTLKHDIHHDPTKGGKTESKKYREQYQSTLALYSEVFGEEPPMDIWPSIDERFKNTEKYIRLNRAKFWVVNKKLEFVFPFLFAPFILAACSDEQGDSDLWFFIKLVVGIYIFYKVAMWIHRNFDGKGGSGGGCGGGCGGCGGG